MRSDRAVSVHADREREPLVSELVDDRRRDRVLRRQFAASLRPRADRGACASAGGVTNAAESRADGSGRALVRVRDRRELRADFEHAVAPPAHEHLVRLVPCQ